MKLYFEFTIFIERYGEKLRSDLLFALGNFCRGKNIAPSYIEDYTHDAILKLESTFEQLRSKQYQSVLYYCFKIAKYKLYDGFKKTNRIDLGDDFLEAMVSKNKDFENFEQQQLYEVVKSILVEDDFDIMYLKFYEGYSYDAIAEKFGLTTSNVKVRIVKAKSMLNKWYNKDMPAT